MIESSVPPKYNKKALLSLKLSGLMILIPIILVSFIYLLDGNSNNSDIIIELIGKIYIFIILPVGTIIGIIFNLLSFKEIRLTNEKGLYLSIISTIINLFFALILAILTNFGKM